MVCKKCGIEKESVEFWNKSRGSSKMCNDCWKGYFRERIKIRRELEGEPGRELARRRASLRREYKLGRRDRCAVCGEVISATRDATSGELVPKPTPGDDHPMHKGCAKLLKKLGPEGITRLVELRKQIWGT